MKVLAIIPARSGSKRLPNKNIRDLNGFPLIYWTIKAALDCRYELELVVSTDCPEIATISQGYGARVPVLRPKSLARDTSTTSDAIFHMADYLKKSGEQYSCIVILQPTSPLRSHRDIEGALQQFFENELIALTSICEIEHPIQWVNRLPSNKSMVNFISSDASNKRSQDLEKFYRLNGAINLIQWNFFLKNKTLQPKSKHESFLMPIERSVDIDNEFGAAFAEFLLKRRLK